MDIITLLIHSKYFVQISDTKICIYSYRLYKMLKDVYLIYLSFLIMQALPCKPDSQKETTFRCTCLCLHFSPWRRHKLCPAGDLFVCWALSQHSAALQAEKQSNYLSLLPQDMQMLKGTTSNKTCQVLEKTMAPFRYLYVGLLLVQLVSSQTCECQHSLQIQSV